jgi:hypothetical protein
MTAVHSATMIPMRVDHVSSRRCVVAASSDLWSAHWQVAVVVAV